MGVLSEIENRFREEIDTALDSDREYRKTEKELHDYVVSVVSADNLDNFEMLFSNFTAAAERCSVEIGMKFGAKIIDELLK